MLERHLRQALAHAALGREHIARQRQIILDLDSAGSDATTARELLETFEQMQVLHEADVHRLTNAIAQLGARDDV